MSARRRLRSAIEGFSKLLFTIVGFIMRVAPIGALGAMAYTIGSQGLGALRPLAGLMACFYATCLLFVFGVLGLVARVHGFSILAIVRHIREELLIVLGTSSSETVLPRLMDKLERLGVRRSVVGLVVPTGYSFNLDGTCIYLTMAAVFLAQATDTPMSLGQQLLMLAVLLLTSKGAAGVTGSGFIVLAGTLASVNGPPVAALALILGIDRFMSEARALTNLVGNAVATLVVARWTGAIEPGGDAAVASRSASRGSRLARALEVMLPAMTRPFTVRIARLVAAALALSGAGLVHAAAVCHRPSSPAMLQPLQDVMATGRFIAYAPTQIKFYNGVATKADEAGIEADLRALRSRFDGVITYSAMNGAEKVADVAARLGFRAVIVGIWSLDDPREVQNAIAAARRQPRVVAGFSVGNERIFAKELTVEAITSRLRTLRSQVPAVPLTTTEPFHIFVPPGAKALLGEMDFMLANVHPVFQPWFAGATDPDAARFVVNVVGELAREYCGPILVKETGVPTAPVSPGFSPQRQASFFAELRKQFPPSRERAFSYFSAFDAAWRVTDSHPGVTTPQPQEGSWGLWEENRRPKPAAQALPLLQGR